MIWRLVNRNRQDEEDDPALVRHLHDICAIKSKIVLDFAGFVQRVQDAFKIDKSRGNQTRTMTLAHATEFVSTILHKDELYKKEYNFFVNNMSYAKSYNTISFERAMKTFDELLMFF